MRKPRPWIIGGALLIVLGVGYWFQGASRFEPPETEYGERADFGGFYTLFAEDGKTVAHTALELGIGDQYINEDNHLFEITAIRGDDVTVRTLGEIDMPDVSDALEALDRLLAGAAATSQPGRDTGSGRGLLAALTRSDRPVVGIYHTHNAESYKPTSGTAFKDEGDILSVGQALADELESLGADVTWNESSHLPHDGQAYLRSRRTAMKLSRQSPRTLLDIHRDAIPNPETYLATVAGETMSKVRLVVGRQNQNRAANLEYAKRMKAIADERYPGLVMGIFHARGNYNQDLGPRMMLMEFGTHVTSLEDAIRSTKPMAAVITVAAGIASGAGDGSIGAASVRTALWILVLAALAGAGWLALNKEDWHKVKAALGRWTNKVRGDDGSA